jgi:putative membrane protein
MMKRFFSSAALALSCALVMALFAHGADKALSDKDFVTKAATFSAAEAKMCKLADKNASDPKVKELAQQLSKDHAKMDEQLKEVAEKVGATVLPNFDADIRGTLDGLAARKGAEFDQAFVTRIVQDHEKAVKFFEAQAKATSDTNLKKFCNDNLPKLQDHLKEARKVADGLKK